MGLYGYPTYNPVSYNPGYIPVVRAIPGVQDPNTRALINFQNFRVINQRFVAGTPTADQVIAGTVEVSQNPVTDFLNGNDAQFKIYVQSSGMMDLTGQNIQVGPTAADDCTTTTGTTVSSK